MIPFVFVAAGYLLGSVPFGLLIARSRGLDIRTIGSGNIGATNVGRALGRKLGVVVFILDFVKGALPVIVARQWAEPSWLPVAAGLASFLGHLFPIWLRFRGGKGVATGAGVVSVLVPLPTLGAALVWLSLFSSLGYISLASLAGAAALAGLRLLLTPDPFDDSQIVLTIFCLSAFLLVVIRHRDNIGRIRRGTENRVEEKPIMRSLAKTIHALSVSLWFGGAVFFTFVVAPLLFKTFESYGEMGFNERPPWLPVASMFNKESGTRLAGAAVAPIFPFYFMVQGACGFLALLTSMGWTKADPTTRVHRVRFLVLLLALLTVIVGWPIAQKVSALRYDRFSIDPAISDPAKQAFGMWHAISLNLSFITILLVGIATALIGWLPGSPATVKPTPTTS
jgi:glycerol-3-phosphate acyltransferase PlsY